MSVLHLTKEKFDETIKTGICVVDFWATWCGPCRMLTPIIDQIADELDGEFTICKVNVDEQLDLAQQFGVNTIPTLIYFKDGKEFERTVGLVPKQAIIDNLKRMRHI